MSRSIYHNIWRRRAHSLSLNVATTSSSKILPCRSSPSVAVLQYRATASMLAITTAVLTSWTSTTANNSRAVCAGENLKNESKDRDRNDNDDDEYEIDETCPFCRFFLESPCRNEFIRWHNCVKKEENPTDCMEPFRPLKACMDENGINMDEGHNEENEEEGGERIEQ